MNKTELDPINIYDFRLVRKCTGVTQNELAERLGITHASVVKRELQEQDIKVGTLIRYLKNLNAKVNMTIEVDGYDTTFVIPVNFDERESND